MIQPTSLLNLTVSPLALAPAMSGEGAVFDLSLATPAGAAAAVQPLAGTGRPLPPTPVFAFAKSGAPEAADPLPPILALLAADAPAETIVPGATIAQPSESATPAPLAVEPTQPLQAGPRPVLRPEAAPVAAPVPSPAPLLTSDMPPSSLGERVRAPIVPQGASTGAARFDTPASVRAVPTIDPVAPVALAATSLPASADPVQPIASANGDDVVPMTIAPAELHLATPAADSTPVGDRTVVAKERYAQAAPEARAGAVVPQPVSEAPTAAPSLPGLTMAPDQQVSPQPVHNAAAARPSRIISDEETTSPAAPRASSKEKTREQVVHASPQAIPAHPTSTPTRPATTREAQALTFASGQVAEPTEDEFASDSDLKHAAVDTLVYAPPTPSPAPEAVDAWASEAPPAPGTARTVPAPAIDPAVSPAPVPQPFTMVANAAATLVPVTAARCTVSVDPQPSLSTASEPSGSIIVPALRAPGQLQQAAIMAPRSEPTDGATSFKPLDVKPNSGLPITPLPVAAPATPRASVAPTTTARRATAAQPVTIQAAPKAPTLTLAEPLTDPVATAPTAPAPATPPLAALAGATVAQPLASHAPAAATPSFAPDTTRSATPSDMTPTDAPAPSNASPRVPLPMSPAPLLAAGTTAPAFRLFAAAIHAARTEESDRGTPLTASLAATEQPRAILTVAGAEGATLDMADHRWPEAMVARIERMQEQVSATRDAASTAIRLVPDALGTIDVGVRRDGDTVHVHFAAESAQTRALLADAQPRLQELAEAKGLRLAQGNVGAGTDGQGQRQPAPQSPIRSAPPLAARDDESELTITDRVA